MSLEPASGVSAPQILAFLTAHAHQFKRRLQYLSHSSTIQNSDQLPQRGLPASGIPTSLAASVVWWGHVPDSGQQAAGGADLCHFWFETQGSRCELPTSSPPLLW